jgi:hypothetical protein
MQLLLSSVLLLFPSYLAAQAVTCPDSLRSAMKFLHGTWKGRSYSIVGSDTTFDAEMSVQSQPVYGGCLLEERWSAANGGKTLFRAKVLRGYDAPSRRWLIYYVDDQLNSQFYEGVLENEVWRFLRTRREADGKPIIVRLTWRPTSDGYEQLIERSRDGGRSWTRAGWVTFRSASAPPNQESQRTY